MEWWAQAPESMATVRTVSLRYGRQSVSAGKTDAPVQKNYHVSVFIIYMNNFYIGRLHSDT